MRVLVGIFLVLAGPVVAAPTPPPPDDFAALQYVDDAGCVFERDDGGWRPRLDKTGARICGFPPTLSTRRTDPEADRVLPLGQPQPEPTPEDVLLEALASGLRAGEFTADPRLPETRRDAAPAEKSALTVELDEIVSKQAAFEAAIATPGSAPTGLCDKLGYIRDPDGRPALGQDVTLGLCPGMRAVTLSAQVQEEARNPSARPVTTDVAATAKPAQTPRSAAGQLQSRRVMRPAAGASVVARRADGDSRTDKTVEMIPASARYVQVGRYAEDANANGAIRRLSDLGYPVAQSYAREGVEKNGGRVRVILAGPFRDRQTLIEALNRLRASGYARATAR